MSARSVRIVLFSTFALAGSLAFAGGQPAKVYTPNKNEAADRSGITSALQQGKGSGTMRAGTVLKGNAYRSATAQDDGAVRDDPPAVQSNRSDSAFRK